MQSKNRRIIKNEQGFASIAIALVLIVVLALLTVGFAQLARREQQSALNKQLANQAYYAAESGINDTVTAVKAGIDGSPSGITTSTPNVGGTKCLNQAQPGLHPDINTDQGVGYSCILVNLKPKALEKDIPANGDWSTYFSTDLTTPPDSVTLKWQSNGGKSLQSAIPSGFTPSGSWNAMAVMQFSVTPLSNLTRNNLITSTFTVYAYPKSGGGSIGYSIAAGDQGQIKNASCTKPATSTLYYCQLTITGLPAAPSTSPAGNVYAVHIHDYYDASHAVITAQSGANVLQLGDSQYTIDATGKAREVLKRLYVHVPYHTPVDLPDGALQAQDICKYFTTDPIDGSKDQSNSLAGTYGTTPAVLDACSPS